MKTIPPFERATAQVAAAERLWLFLDYDGTLDDLAPTPEHVTPTPEVVSLVTRLAGHSRIRVAIISGRRLGHVRKLVPVPGVLLAGTYGIELWMPWGERIDRLNYDRVRPTLDAIKPQWMRLLDGRQGFFLEDKGWSLAIHARYAAAIEAERVLSAGRNAVEMTLAGNPDMFRVLGGHRFLEVGPKLAHKGKTVRHLLAEYPLPGALPVYLGDDDKDEEAFRVIKELGGIALLVSPEPRDSSADYRLESPQSARSWLEALLSQLSGRQGPPSVPNPIHRDIE